MLALHVSLMNGGGQRKKIVGDKIVKSPRCNFDNTFITRGFESLLLTENLIVEVFSNTFGHGLFFCSIKKKKRKKCFCRVDCPTKDNRMDVTGENLTQHLTGGVAEESGK